MGSIPTPEATIKYTDMRNKIITLLLLAFVAFTVACQRDSHLLPDETMRNQKDTVSVSFGFNLVNIVKAAVNEILVENVNLYITDELGNVISSGYYTSSRSLDIGIYSNQLYSIYAIANAGYEIKAASVEEIESLVYRISEINDIVSPAGGILMSGKAALQKLVDGQHISINLTRCLSKVVFQCDFSALNNDVVIEVKSVQLKNIPACVNIFTGSRIEPEDRAISSAAVISPDQAVLQSGITFYCFENLQGTLLPANTDQKNKLFDASSIYAKICSYIEIVASYSSPRKKGDITYRFYCGKDDTGNFDLPRNYQQTITVKFTGDGAVDENTWRVDNSDIIDLVISVSVEPQSYTFKNAGEAFQLSATVLPATAENRQIMWSSSNTDVATVDSDGVVTSVAPGNCSIYAASVEDPSKKGECEIMVGDVQIKLPEGIRIMYDGEVVKIPYSLLVPSDADVEISLDNMNAELLSNDQSGITVKGITPGTCTLTAKAGNSSDTCTLEIQKLTITPRSSDIVLYNEFYEDMAYTITPEHASGLNVDITAAGSGIVAGYDAVSNRVMPQYDIQTTSFPASSTIRLSIEGRPDVFADINAVVKPSINIVQDSVELMTAIQGDDAKTLTIDTHPRGVLAHTWIKKAKSLKFGTVSREITLSAPTYDNGEFPLEISTTTDLHSDKKVSDTCSVLVSETIFLIGYPSGSSAVRDNHTSSNVYIYEYTNDIMGKYTAHPDSKQFAGGIVDLPDRLFSYKGKTGSINMPVATETYEFEFKIGTTYKYVFDDGELTFRGSAVPRYYLSFYHLTPIGDTLLKLANKSGNLIRCRIKPVTFPINGFSDSALAWQKILPYLFP